MPQAPTTAATSDTAQKSYLPPAISAVAGAAAGSSPTVVVTGKDTGATLSITTGATGTGTGVLATVNFPTPISQTPVVLMTPTNAAAASLTQTFVNNMSKSGFNLMTGTAPTASTTYTWVFLAALG